jgi:hypothetical protein
MSEQTVQVRKKIPEFYVKRFQPLRSDSQFIADRQTNPALSIIDSQLPVHL